MYKLQINKDFLILQNTDTNRGSGDPGAVRQCEITCIWKKERDVKRARRVSLCYFFYFFCRADNLLFYLNQPSAQMFSYILQTISWLFPLLFPDTLQARKASAVTLFQAFIQETQHTNANESDRAVKDFCIASYKYYVEKISTLTQRTAPGNLLLFYCKCRTLYRCMWWHSFLQLNKLTRGKISTFLINPIITNHKKTARESAKVCTPSGKEFHF